MILAPIRHTVTELSMWTQVDTESYLPMAYPWKPGTYLHVRMENVLTLNLYKPNPVGSTFDLGPGSWIRIRTLGIRIQMFYKLDWKAKICFDWQYPNIKLCNANILPSTFKFKNSIQNQLLVYNLKSIVKQNLNKKKILVNYRYSSKIY